MEWIPVQGVDITEFFHFRNSEVTFNEKHKKTEYQINDIKSKTGCRIEHVFRYMTVSMHGLTLRSVGIKRAEFNIGLTNLVYNICRYSILKREGCVTG